MWSIGAQPGPDPEAQCDLMIMRYEDAIGNLEACHASVVAWDGAPDTNGAAPTSAENSLVE